MKNNSKNKIFLFKQRAVAHCLMTIVVFIVLSGSSVAVAEHIMGKVFGYDIDRKPTPLKNARIVAMPSMKGAMSSANGEFMFDALDSDSLVIISYSGYKTDTLIISEIVDKRDIQVQMQNIELEGVEVGGNKYASTLAFTDGVKTETISSRGLLKAACCNLSESFTTTPSVDVQYTDAITGAKRIQLLGLQSMYSQIQQENMPIMRGLASNYGFAFVPGQWLEGISISKGASTVKNGFESISGLINITHKKPESENPTTLNYYINDMTMMEFNADHTINFNETTGTTFFLHGNLLAREMDNNKDGFLDKPMGNQINFMNRWKTSSGIWEDISGYQIMYDDRKGGQLGYHKGNDSLWGMRNKTQRYNVYTKNGFILNEAGMNVGSILSFTHHNQESFFGNRKFNGEQNSFYASIMFQLPIDTTTHTHEDGGSHNMFCNSALTAGVSLQYDNYRGLFDNFYYTKLKTNNDASVVIPGLFIEYAFDLIKDFKAIIGMRTDFATLGNPIKMYEEGEKVSDIYSQSLNETLLTPRLHLKYGIIPDTFIVAGSIGRGHRAARALEENSGYLASNRKYILESYNTIEDAWNYGANMYYTTGILGIPVDFNMDFYRTDFVNQLVVDLDKSADEVNLYSLKSVDGKSYSNAFQVDATLQPLTNFFITLAYRMNDVKMTLNGELREKPLQSKHKAFLNFQYNTEMNEWMFDFTIDYNGSGRLPKDANNEYKRYDPFILMNAQITKSFGNFDIYVGGENLTNFMIKDAIKGNLNPKAVGFDASMIYGPVTGMSAYLGLRYKLY
jgi:hypothetical protein